MKYEIIKTENYLLIVDKSEIKGWYYDAYINKVKHSGGAEYGESIITRNIISHLPLNGSPILEGVDLLPPLPSEEDDVEKFSNSDFPIGTWSSDAVALGLDMYKTGYNKAKEKYKYTEEDMRKAFLKGVSVTAEGYNAEYAQGNDPDIECEFGEKADKFIQSLSQPKMPIGFERYHNYVPTMLGEHIAEAKTTTTPEGHTQWVGKYIYE